MSKKRMKPQGEPNSKRRNGKAWKRRACGQRHAVTDQCRGCNK